MRKSHPEKTRGNPARSGVFAAEPSELLDEINCSVEFDYLLAPQELKVGAAHVTALREKGIINKAEEAKLREGLRKITEEINEGVFKWRRRFEDVHMNIEARLRELVGEAADKFHSGRSRNDLVATDLRLWIKDAIKNLDKHLAKLQATLLKRAEGEATTVMPGFTHLQPAAVVTMGSHLLAHAHALGRDRQRLQGTAVRCDSCPMGAAALAGSTLAGSREKIAKRLGFAEVAANPLDAVSARDFALEFLAAAAIGGITLSRLAEELVLWACPSFDFVELPDEWSTGSSILPHKRNPDAAELVRARAGRQLGWFVALGGVLKGLPLAYSKDLQEDKQPVFAAAASWELMLKATDGMMKTIKFRRDKLAGAASDGRLLAVDIAEWLVTHKKVPFRTAHKQVGTLVALAAAENCEIHQLPLARIRETVPKAAARMLDEVNLQSALAQRRLCTPQAVKKEIADLKKRWRLR